MTTPAKFTIGADLFRNWMTDVESGKPPVRFELADPFACLDVRPGRLLLFGGPPGCGKTAALLQMGIDMLRLNESARLLIANVEMSSTLLLERITSRLSAVPLTSIANRSTTPEELDRVRAAVASLDCIAERLAFLDPPYSLEHVQAAATATGFDANLMVIDYIQRFAIGNGSKDKREQLDDAVTVLRRFCDAGAVVMVAAAVARQRGQQGSNYRGLNLASFRGSSELEYGCDSAFILVPDEDGGIKLQCEKNRFGPVDDIPTAFDPTTQTFMASVERSGLEAFDAATPTKKSKAKGGE